MVVIGAAFSIFWLAIFSRLHSNYSQLFWPFSGGCVLIIFGRSGHLWVAAILLFSGVFVIFGQLHFYYYFFRSFLAIFGRPHFVIFGRYGHHLPPPPPLFGDGESILQGVGLWFDGMIWQFFY